MFICLFIEESIIMKEEKPPKNPVKVMIFIHVFLIRVNYKRWQQANLVEKALA